MPPVPNESDILKAPLKVLSLKHKSCAIVKKLNSLEKENKENYKQAKMYQIFVALSSIYQLNNSMN